MQYPAAQYPPAPGMPQWGYQQQRSTNGLAIASLILGIVWIFWLGSALALVFGIIARRQIRDSNGNQGGAGLATAGIVLGSVGAVTLVAFIALAVLVPSGSVSDHDNAAKADLTDLAAAELAYYTDHGTYTLDASALAPSGDIATADPELDYTPDVNDSIQLGYSGAGFCGVVNYIGNPSWFLYDSTQGGVVGTAYSSAFGAEKACQAPNIQNYFPLETDV